MDLRPDDFTEYGLKEVIKIAHVEGINEAKFDDLDDMFDELEGNFEVVGSEWEPYEAAIGGSYNHGGIAAEGGYFGSLKITLFNVDITDFVEEKVYESMRETLSEERMAA